MTIIVAIIWRIVAYVVTRPAITAWLIERAKRAPYYPIVNDGNLYMRRGWVFNGYRKDGEGRQLPARWRGLPSVRLHHIVRADRDRHLHDHPWPARTIVLRGWYDEERPIYEAGRYSSHDLLGVSHGQMPSDDRVVLHRSRGYTGTLAVGQFHRIGRVAADGAWTLFFTWGESNGWGFRVGDRRVPHAEYLDVKG
jgi:hypothetical protein